MEDQPIPIPPDGCFDSSSKHGVRAKFVLSDTDIQEFRIDLDGDGMFR